MVERAGRGKKKEKIKKKREKKNKKKKNKKKKNKKKKKKKKKRGKRRVIIGKKDGRKNLGSISKALELPLL